MQDRIDALLEISVQTQEFLDGMLEASMKLDLALTGAIAKFKERAECGNGGDVDGS